MRFAFAIAMLIIAPSAFAAEQGELPSWRTCFSQRILEARSVPDEKLLRRLESDCRKEQRRNCTIEYGMTTSAKAKQLEQTCIAEAEK